MVHNDLIVEVVLDLPIEKPLYYKIPEELNHLVKKGKRLLVPLGRRQAVGYVLKIVSVTDTDLPKSITSRGVLKDVIDVLDEKPLFHDRELKLYQWISAYYFAPLGDVIKTALVGEINPREDRRLSVTDEGKKVAGADNHDEFDFEVLHYLHTKGVITYNALVRKFKGKSLCHSLSYLKKKGLISETVNFKQRKRRNRSAEVLQGGKLTPHDKSFILSKEQKNAIATINKGIQGGTFSPYLLFGVTGSGKTEVYMSALEETFKEGKKAIFLVPEISLTQHVTQLLLARFPDRVAVIHSGLTEREKYDQWQRIKNDQADVAFGARSAIFAPFKNLGLIIVDEEHDTSYKQEEGVRYHARDVAVMMGKLMGATVILGSATPSIESFHNAGTGRFRLLELPERIHKKELPEVEIVDMKKESKNEVISGKLKEAIQSNLSQGFQTILFLNRRGFSYYILCKDCGYVSECKNCNVSLTFHRSQNILRCHYCNFSLIPPRDCPQCHGHSLLPVGFGTERLEEEIMKTFPEATIARFEGDAFRKKSHRGVIKEVEKGAIDILIGTQVITKGHHFPLVTLVGVVSGDSSLNFPDFRASEKTFQLVTQVAGRAGRGQMPGKVIIQSFNPQEPCFQMALKHDYISLFNEEIVQRKETRYPPFWRTISLRLEDKKEEKVHLSSQRIRNICDAILKATPQLTRTIEVLGPTPAFLSRIREKYRWHLLIKGQEVKTLHTFVRKVRDTYLKSRMRVKLIVVVDPVNLL
jgi:primosomal protein N' (replication factor Y)